jgi:hypothetical protein
VLAVCRELELIHAVDPFVRASLTPDVTYRRFHAWIDPKNETYVMFNNELRHPEARRRRRISGCETVAQFEILRCTQNDVGDYIDVRGESVISAFNAHEP